MSSLQSILNSSFGTAIEAKIFALVEAGTNQEWVSRYSIGKNKMSTALYINRTDICRNYVYSYLVRMIAALLRGVNVDVFSWIEGRIIRSIEKEYSFDYIVAFSEGAATRFVSRFNNPKKIAWIHCDYARCVKEVEKERKIYLAFQKIVCVSEFTRNSFCHIFPQLASKTVSISNILDSENILRLSKEPISDSLFKYDQFTLLSVGRISAVKRYSSIPSIASVLLEKGKRFRWYIIGPAIEKEEHDKLVENIQYYHVQDQVIVLGAKSNPYPYFTKASMLVSLSSSEACPMVFNEAKILNVPILSADFGSAFEFIEQGRDGYITTLERMPQRILELIESEDKLQVIRQNEYMDSNDKIIEQLNNLFNQ